MNRREFKPRSTTSAIAVVAAGALVVALRAGTSSAQPIESTPPSVASASSATPAIEVWGLTPADRVEIDGTPVPVHGGPPFAGDPAAPSPPVRWFTAPGHHAITVTRASCLRENFNVETQGALTTTIIVAPLVEARCAIAAPAPRQVR